MSYTILEALVHNSKSMPDHIAIVDEEGELTYQQLVQEIKKVARILSNRGISSNCKVLIEAMNKKKFIITYFAIHSLGAICAPYSKKTKEANIDYIIEEINPEFIIHENVYKSTKDSAINYSEFTDVKSGDYELGFPDENNVSDILFTSGTTGVDKGVVLTHKSTYYSACNIAQILEITTADLVLLPLPLYHSNGLGTVRTYLKEGASIILLDGVMSVNYIKKMLLRYPCSAFSCSPVMLEVLDMLTDGEYVNLFQNLRYIEIGTAPVTERLRQILRERFPRQRLFINYGATESPRAVYMDLNCQEYKKLESIGQTIGDYDAIVLDDDNTIISERNRIGKLALGGRAIMQGYWNNDHLTKQVLVGSHYLTGDMAYIDKDNYVYLQGRIHDLIIIGGEKVFPNEIERMLLEMPDIYECAVIGVEYTRHFVGQQPVAFVVMKKNAVFQMELINKYLESKLELFKIPNKIISIDQLPRNIMGKVDRNSLRKMLERM